jgi:hypothetical protein
MIWGAPHPSTRPHSAPSLLLCHTPQDQRPHIADQCSLNHERQPGIVNAVETIRDVRKAELDTQNQSVCSTAAIAASLNKRFNPTCVRRTVLGNLIIVRNAHTRVNLGVRRVSCMTTSQMGQLLNCLIAGVCLHCLAAALFQFRLIKNGKRKDTHLH